MAHFVFAGSFFVRVCDNPIMLHVPVPGCAATIAALGRVHKFVVVNSIIIHVTLAHMTPTTDAYPKRLSIHHGTLLLRPKFI